MRHLAKYLPMNEEFFIFCDDSLAWMSSKALVLIPFLEGLTDYAIAVFAALAIFITRSKKALD